MLRMLAMALAAAQNTTSLHGHLGVISREVMDQRKAWTSAFRFSTFLDKCTL